MIFFFSIWSRSAHFFEMMAKVRVYGTCARISKRWELKNWKYYCISCSHAELKTPLICATLSQYLRCVPHILVTHAHRFYRKSYLNILVLELMIVSCDVISFGPDGTRTKCSIMQSFNVTQKKVTLRHFKYAFFHHHLLLQRIFSVW